MTAEAWLITALVGVVAFMARHYFLRIERHLKISHSMANWFHRVNMRLARIERKLFGKEGALTDDSPLNEPTEDE